VSGFKVSELQGFKVTIQNGEIPALLNLEAFATLKH